MKPAAAEKSVLCSLPLRLLPPQPFAHCHGLRGSTSLLILERLPSGPATSCQLSPVSGTSGRDRGSFFHPRLKRRFADRPSEGNDHV